MDDRLRIPATRALLEGWCGPVEYESRAGWRWGVWEPGEGAVLMGWSVRDHPAEVEYGWQNTSCSCHPGGSLEAHIRLDLSRAEVRDRVARVVAEQLFRRGTAVALRPDFLPNEDGWAMALSDGPTPAIAELAVWDRDGAPAGHPDTPHAPALATLDPSDDTRLSDGSRLVDALALAAVAREVLRG